MAQRPTYTGARAIFASRLGLLAALLLLVLSAWRGYAALGLVSAGVVSAALVVRLWGAAALRGLAFSHRLSAGAVFCGGTADYEFTVSNNKLLPLPWVEAACLLPAALLPRGESDPPPGDRSWRVEQFSLLWYETHRVVLRLECRWRGIYNIGPMVVSSGDLFGLVVLAREERHEERLVVYPRVYPVDRLGLPSRFPLGNSRAATPLFEDPSRTAGLRDYTPGTPFKRIHWKASARRGSLQVKVFEPTTTLRVGLFLDVTGFAPEGAESADLFELALSTAASIACHLEEAGQEVGLAANCRWAGSKRPLNMRPRGGAAHLAALLEGLAGAEARPSGPLEPLWDRAMAEMFPGDTLVLIAARTPPAMLGRLLAARRAGYQAVLLVVGEGPLPGGGITARRVASPRDLGRGGAAS